MKFEYGSNHDIILNVKNKKFIFNHGSEHLFLGIFFAYLNQTNKNQYEKSRHNFPKISNQDKKPEFERRIGLDNLIESLPFETEKKRGLQISNQNRDTNYFYLGPDLSRLRIESEIQRVLLKQNQIQEGISSLISNLVLRHGYDSPRCQEVSWYNKYIFRKLK